MIIERLRALIRGERQTSEISVVLSKLHKVEERMKTAQGAKLEKLTQEKQQLDARFRQLLNERSQNVEARPELSRIEYR